jgi:KAP family P-loop domain
MVLNAPLPNAEPARPVGDTTAPFGARSVPFFADARHGPDLLETGNAIRPLVELIAHHDSQTPMMIAIVGPSGAGKSFVLDRIVAGVDGLSAASGNGPGDIVTVALDATAIASDPITAVATATYAGLTRDDGAGRNYSALADEAAHAGADPHVAASKALERHDEARSRLEAERQSRDELEARRARLSDVVLYETPGSRVDAYTRSSRGRMEARLRRFDLVSGDPTSNFKDLIRDLASVGGGSRIGVALRAIWGYRSQTRLLLTAIIFFVLALGASELKSASFGSWLKGLGAAAATAADWLNAHSDWIGDAVAAFVVIGLLALALNLWRAFIFSASLFRGARLLTFDVRERSRDLDAAAARVNRRVSALTAEAEAAARQAEAAERRAKTRTKGAPTGVPNPTFLEAPAAPQAAARAFLTALARAMSGQVDAGAPPVSVTLTPAAAPERIVLAIDNIDSLPADRALDLIDTIHSILGRAFVAVVAFDPTALQSAIGDRKRAKERLERLFQIAFNVKGASSVGGERLVARLLSGAPAPAQSSTDVRPSNVAEPIGAAEAAVLTAIAPLAATTPRAIKRFLNAYRLARANAVNKAAVAIALAVEQSGDDQARHALENLSAEAGDGPLADPAGPPALLAALRASRAAGLSAVTGPDLRAAMALVKRYQFFE